MEVIERRKEEVREAGVEKEGNENQKNPVPID